MADPQAFEQEDHLKHILEDVLIWEIASRSASKIQEHAHLTLRACLLK